MDTQSSSASNLKRARSDSTRETARDHDIPEPQDSPGESRPTKRNRIDRNDAPNATSSHSEQDAPATPLHNEQSRNVYGSSTISGNATVQMGNASYYSGPGSHLHGPSTVAGDYRVHVSNAFHETPSDPFASNTQAEAALALKRALYYEIIDHRKSQLDHVDSVSFDWVWTGTGLSEWLEGDRGIFWITGKPGSGKSTLMHHLVNSELGSDRVMQHLKIHHRSPMLVYFYFDFRAGTGIANNTQGMLRSLLLQLSEKSDTIQNFLVQRCEHRAGGKWPELESELLDLVCYSLQNQQSSICAFIDGLDEYRGDLRKLVNTILRLQTRAKIKICLASRPEPELLYKLQTESLSMQKYNAVTIKAYIDAAFSTLPQQLRSDELQRIVQRIERDANGVILWARFAIDLAVYVLLQGCTVDEVVVQLDSFPPSLSELYERMLNRLSSVQKLQAAVVIFIIEHWINSFEDCNDTVLLTIEYLMLSSSLILQKVGSASSLCPDDNQTRFKLRIHAMLSGLIEFGQAQSDRWQPPAETPRLVHKSLQTFVQDNEEFASLFESVNAVYDRKVLGPLILAQSLVEASDAYIPHTNMPWPEPSGLLEDSLLSLRKRASSSGMTFSTNSVVDALQREYLNVLDVPEHVALLVKATQTWLYREYQCSKHSHSFCNPTNRMATPALSKIRNPELFDYVRFGCPNAFCKVLETLSDRLVADYQDNLFAYILYKLSWVYESFSFRSGYLVRKKTWLWRVMLLVLRGLGYAAHVLAACVSSAHMAAHEDVFLSLKTADVKSGTKISRSVWWALSKGSTMLCWAMSPYDIDCLLTQKTRLSIILASGVGINEEIYRGGSVMNALFDNELLEFANFLPDCEGRYETAYPREIHISGVKFMILLEAGFDLGTPRDLARFLTSAKRVLADFERLDREVTAGRRTMSLSACITPSSYYKTVIKDLMQYIIPYLHSRIERSNRPSRLQLLTRSRCGDCSKQELLTEISEDKDPG